MVVYGGTLSWWKDAGGFWKKGILNLEGNVYSVGMTNDLQTMYATRGTEVYIIKRNYTGY